jgi:SpoIIAA-like
MIERIADMPEGTIGFRATGNLTRDDYTEALEPAMREAVDAGDVRMLFVIGPEFEGFDAGALAEDAKFGFGFGLMHPSAWKRTAIVTDLGWIRHAMHLFGWMSPGEVAVYGLDREDEARAWVAAD